jgi:hypothetical protein
MVGEALRGSQEWPQRKQRREVSVVMDIVYGGS